MSDGRLEATEGCGTLWDQMLYVMGKSSIISQVIGDWEESSQIPFEDVCYLDLYRVFKFNEMMIPAGTCFLFCDFHGPRC